MTRRALEKERDEHLSKAEAITAALNGNNGHIRSESKPRKAAGGKLTLREAITQAVKSRPLDKKEIVEAVERLGYRFTTKDPVNSLNALLYSQAGKAQFRNQGGKFSVR